MKSNITANNGSLVFCDPRVFGRILYSDCKEAPRWWATRPSAVLDDGFTFERMDEFLSRRAHHLLVARLATLRPLALDYVARPRQALSPV